jgi:hypothetical protein
MDMKEAVKIARENAEILFEGQRLHNLALEEVEFDEKANEWLITLGYDSNSVIKRSSGPSLFPTIEEEKKREYKVFHIGANQGKLVAMKIKNV